MSPWNAARVAALLVVHMERDDRNAFDRMLANRSGHDECAECGLMFDATPADDAPICPACRACRPAPAPKARPRRTMEMGEPGHAFTCKGCGCYLGPGVPDGFCEQCYPGASATPRGWDKV